MKKYLIFNLSPGSRRWTAAVHGGYQEIWVPSPVLALICCGTLSKGFGFFLFHSVWPVVKGRPWHTLPLVKENVTKYWHYINATQYLLNIFSLLLNNSISYSNPLYCNGKETQIIVSVLYWHEPPLSLTASRATKYIFHSSPLHCPFDLICPF